MWYNYGKTGRGRSLEEPFTCEVIAVWKEIFRFVDSNPDARRQFEEAGDEVAGLLDELNTAPAPGIAALLTIALNMTHRLIAVAEEDIEKEKSGAVQ